MNASDPLCLPDVQASPGLREPAVRRVGGGACDKPQFVEDLLRDVALRRAADARSAAWTVESENFAAIPDHSAYPLIEGRKA